jgi:uncharacterized protein
MSARRASDPDLPALGIGITYSAAIEPVLQQYPNLVDVVEVEPQTTWFETRDEEQPFRVLDSVLEHIAQLPGRKIVHSIGAPVGGTLRPSPHQLELLKRTIEYFDSPWATEHLSFNATHGFRTGFFLPPRQTLQGVETAAISIRDLQAGLPVPIGIETGVNYLRPRSDELPDGQFVAAVAEEADCGILLDLHNLYANALNGRQPVDQFLAQIPLNRVWEVHLAGGFEMDGYWLDSHSGAIPEPLIEIAKNVISALPNLKAIIFEMFPSFVPGAGTETIRLQLEKLHELWELRGSAARSASPLGPPVNRKPAVPPANGSALPPNWEHVLGSLAIGAAPRQDPDHLLPELTADPGVPILNKLINEFRASMVVGVYKLTSRFLMLALGPDVFRSLLEDFWSKTPPQQFAASEAEKFADYLVAADLKVPQLAKLLEFERAVVATLMDDQPRVVAFDIDPIPLLRALAEGHLPTVPGSEGLFEIEVTPDGPITATGLDIEAVKQAFPYH